MVHFCGAKSVPPTSSIKMRNCQKNGACMCIYTHVYDKLWASVMKAVPKLDESESGQMVLK